VVSLPSFESFPVLHNVWLLFLFFFSGSVLKGIFCLFLSVSLAGAAHLTGLESTLSSETPILPKQNCAFVIGTSKHASHTIPAHTVDRTIVSGEDGEKSLGLGSFVLEQ
jgi:hypothetical protein